MRFVPGEHDGAARQARRLVHTECDVTGDVWLSDPN